MHHRAIFPVLLLGIFLIPSITTLAQSPKSGSEAKRVLTRSDVYVGYTFLNKDLQGGTGLNGWELGFSTAERIGLRFKADVLSYTGSDNGAPQKPRYYMVGQEFAHGFLGNTLFLHGMIGIAHTGSDWDAATSTNNTTFATDLGGGLDHALIGPVAWRFEGDYMHTHFTANNSAVTGIPENFLRFSTGLVVQF